MRSWIITLASLSALDAVTTIMGLKQPDLVELNPFAVELIKSFGIISGVTITCICEASIAIIIVGLLKWRARWAGTLGLLIIGGQIGVAVLSNLSLCFNLAWFPYGLVQWLLRY